MTDAPRFSDPDEAEEAFYAAFETADLDGMMKLWADDDTITCVHPGGSRLVGREEIRESWRQIFQSQMRLNFRLTERHAITDRNIAVHSVLEEIEVSGQSGLTAVVASTNVFVLTNDGWRIWMHHASNAATSEEESDDAADKPTLH